MKLEDDLRLLDNERMHKLCDNFLDGPDYIAPMAVVFSRSDRLSVERSYLESLWNQVPEHKRADLLGKFWSADEGQHKGAWFELMLFGWLLEHFGESVIMEPALEGAYPDFLLQGTTNQIAIEAKSFLIDPETRRRRSIVDEVHALLKSIPLNHVISIESIELNDRVRATDFVDQVGRWLRENPAEPFVYAASTTETIELTTVDIPNRTNHVLTIGPASDSTISGKPLRRPLKKKASAHKGIRSVKLPYVIAVYLEPHTLSAEEVVEAWLGQYQIIIDTNSGEVVEERLSGDGIHFWDSTIVHRSVSGTLVFKAYWIPEWKRHRLSAWYVQNPYATTRLEPFFFPVVSSFHVVAPGKMRWGQEA